MMKDITFVIAPFACLPGLIAQVVPVSVEEAESWWEKANKHGVGFVFFVLFLSLMVYQMIQDKKREAQRVAREDAANLERAALQTEIRDLNQRQLEQAEKHGRRLETIVKDGTKAQEAVAAEIRNMARKIQKNVTSPPEE